MDRERDEKYVQARWKQSRFAFLLFLATASAHAALIDYGTTEGISFRNCVAGSSGCDDTQLVQFSYGGFPGAPTSTASASLEGYGTATGNVGLSGTIGAPILGASTTSAPGTRQNTNSVALQRYTYTGSQTTTRTFGGTLTYSQSLTGTYPVDIGNGIYAAIDIFTLPAAFVDVGETAESNFNALIDEQDFPGYVSLALATYEDTNSTSNGMGTFGATVTLDPGDAVWVWVLLQTPAVDGGFVDAAHTLVTAWDNTRDLVPAIVAVPEPGSLALVGAAMAAIGFLPRRPRTP
jgi:hypothetical protein